MCSSSRPRAPAPVLPPPPPPPPLQTTQTPTLLSDLQGKRLPSRRTGVGALRIDQNLASNSVGSGLVIPTGV